MQIKKIEVGELACNCYLIEKDNCCLLIDPGDELGKIQNWIKGKNIIGILVTHSHFDHIGCVEKLHSKFHYPIYNFENILDKNLTIGPFSIEVIYTSGHSKDSVCYYFKKNRVMFVGDFIFKGTIGRCDLEGGNFEEMLESIEKIKQYDKNTVLYPGHGEATTLQHEIDFNPYFHK